MDFVTPGYALVIWLIFILFALLLPVLALVSILKNKFRDNDKLIWILVVLFLPILGSILYFIIGRSKRLKIIN
ncbi:PLDc N-terminal domain-containing protein [Winogradskyella sp. PE311]|uniref:PLDc N-terminal domain-containing protein n=1 Tax=Winogradskyella sp. PE311 TaxID=3366943 RepID=UPI00398156D6